MGESLNRPILSCLETIYKAHANALAQHISSNGGGEYSIVLSAIHSFKIKDERELWFGPASVAEPAEPVEPAEPAESKTLEEFQSQILYKIIIYYSDKYHAIFGDKNLIKPIFDKIGRFQLNSNLSRGKGWIFPFNKLEKLEIELKKHSLLYSIENGPCFKKLVGSSSPGQSPVSSPDQSPESGERRVISLNKFGRHEDPSTGLVFRQIEGIVSAYGIQIPSGEVVDISDEMRVYCQQKGYPIAEFDEWEDDENYNSSSDEYETEHTDGDDKDNPILKDLSEDEPTDGEDVIEGFDEEDEES